MVYAEVTEDAAVLLLILILLLALVLVEAVALVAVLVILHVTTPATGIHTGHDLKNLPKIHFKTARRHADDCILDICHLERAFLCQSAMGRKLKCSNFLDSLKWRRNRTTIVE